MKNKWKPGLLIRTNGTCEAVQVDLRSDVKDLYPLIDTNVVQMVESGKFKIWLDEEGKLKGKPVNRVATKLWNYPGDMIVGDVVVV